MLLNYIQYNNDTFSSKMCLSYLLLLIGNRLDYSGAKSIQLLLQYL